MFNIKQFNERKKLSSKACQVELPTDSKHKRHTVSSVACQVDTLPAYNGTHNPTISPVNSKPVQTEVASFSETDSVESSTVSEVDEDIITIVTADRVSASMLHTDSDASNDSVDQEEHIVTPLCSPSNNPMQAVKDFATLHNMTGIDNVPRAKVDSNKKSVRFQDSIRDHDVKPLQSNSTTVAPDKVFIHCIMYVSVCTILGSSYR